MDGGEGSAKVRPRELEVGRLLLWEVFRSAILDFVSCVVCANSQVSHYHQANISESSRKGFENNRYDRNEVTCENEQEYIELSSTCVLLLCMS